MEALSDEQLQQLGEFQTITGIDSVETALDWMTSHQWNLEKAVQSVFGGSSNDISESVASPTQTEGVRRRRANSNSNSNSKSNSVPSTAASNSKSSGPAGTLGSKTRPHTPPMTFWQRLFYPITLSLRVVWVLIRFATSIFPLNLIFGSSSQRITPTSARDPQATAARFLLDYESKYGTNHPAFFQGTYSQALEVSKRELRCLLVVLYCAEHDDMDTFCNQVLSNELLLEYLREKRFVVWAGDVKESEAFVVSNTLLATRYPFLGMIAPQGGSRMVVVERFEGLIDPETLRAALQAQMNRVDGVLNNARADRNRHDQARILREQQDAAYNASLKADQEKARRAQEERERIAKEAAEEERKQKELLDKRETKKQRKIRLQENMLPEPSVSDTVDIAKIGIRLPSGERLTRRFKASIATVQDLYDFVEAQDLTPIDLDSDFEVINTYPRKVLVDKSQTIKVAGLFPTSSVMVEEMDNE